MAGLRAVMLGDVRPARGATPTSSRSTWPARARGARTPGALGAPMAVLLGARGVAEDADRALVRALIVSTLGFAALATADDPALTPAQLRADLEATLDWLLRGALPRS